MVFVMYIQKTENHCLKHKIVEINSVKPYKFTYFTTIFEVINLIIDGYME